MSFRFSFATCLKRGRESGRSSSRLIGRRCSYEDEVDMKGKTKSCEGSEKVRSVGRGFRFENPEDRKRNPDFLISV
ncbi:hypothetical protein SLA2020_432480 [Shorea laevis]